jgi:hypothetical protein
VLWIRLLTSTTAAREMGAVTSVVIGLEGVGDSDAASTPTSFVNEGGGGAILILLTARWISFSTLLDSSVG